jgi:DegV family protein with EDD domain
MPEHRVALLTDSTCDIPQELIHKYQITVIPQMVIWGEETYQDRVDISPREFYRRLESENDLPSTTQPSPGTFERYYQEAREKGAEEVVILTVSSALSGTYQLAKKVGAEMNFPVHVVDSRGPTMSLGWQVLAAARERERGGVVEDMLRVVEQTRQKLSQVVLLDSLKFLHRGGRIGTAKRLLGSVLNIKPLVKINHEEGGVEAAGQTRTREKGMEMLIERFLEGVHSAASLRIAVLHGNAEQEAQNIMQRLKDMYHPVEILSNITGPVLGVNTGPRALAICGYSEEPLS